MKLWLTYLANMPHPNETRPTRPLPERLNSTASIKHSLRSHSSSFEADDELSSSDTERVMGPNTRGHRRAGSQYVGEDTRLTSKRELAGWYAYGFAAEVFVICGMGKYKTHFFGRFCVLYETQDTRLYHPSVSE